MKKMIGAMFVFTMIAAMAQGREILTESYVNAKVGQLLSQAPVFVNNASRMEFRGLKVTRAVLDAIGTSDSPFYMKSRGATVAVRVGDYLVSQGAYGPVTPVRKQAFEGNHSSADGSVRFDANERLDMGPTDYTKVDESKEMASESGDRLQ
ncbi:MAG: hypothetical protein LBQ97_02775 [Fusobacteriaceae bacterium]|jgi:hypothetical protein|nr:hypothetical protein [Fusobacteriaceae bacterium]